MTVGWESPDHGYESDDVGYDTGSGALRRGRFMGFTLPYGGYQSPYPDLAGPDHADVFWIRCGFPEIQNMLSTPSDPADAGTLDLTELEDEVAAVHADGHGFHFSMLGVPKQVHPDAGTGGNWKYYPTTDPGRAQMAAYAVEIAHVLMDSSRATGLPVYFECFQEPNIPAFNPAAQSSATVGRALAAVHLAVRAAEPDLPIIGASLANRGDLDTPGPDVGWIPTDFMNGMLAGDTRLKNTAAPDLWGYHDYVGQESPLDMGPGWGMRQFVSTGLALAFSGAKAYDGTAPKMCVTEFGSQRIRTFNVQSRTGNQITASGGKFIDSDVGCPISLDTSDGTVTTTILSRQSSTKVTVAATLTGTVTSASVTNEERQFAQIRDYFTIHDQFRRDGWVTGPEELYLELGDEKSIYRSSGDHDPFDAGVWYEYISKLEIAPPPPPPPPPPVVNPLPKVRLELGVRPGVNADLTPWFKLGHPTRGKLGGPAKLAPPFVYFPLDGYWTDIVFGEGYNQERGAIEPGTLDAMLENRDRIFDKRNKLGPYWPGLRPPAVRLRLYVDDKLLKTVIVDKLNPQYTIDDAVAPIAGADALSILARTPIRFYAKTAMTQLRLNRILDHAGWREGRFIPPGFFELGNYDIDALALDEINKIAEAEDTLVYCSQDNTFVFVPRGLLTSPPVVTFSDDGTDGTVDYKEITYSDGNATFANAIRVTRRQRRGDADEPQPQGYTDWDSVNDITNGVPVELDITDSPVSNDGGALLQAGLIGSRYAQPVDRIDSITLDLADFLPDTRAKLLALTVGSPVRAVHHPDGGGEANDQVSVVIGRTLAIPDPDCTRLPMTFRLRSMDGGI